MYTLIRQVLGIFSLNVQKRKIYMATLVYQFVINHWMLWALFVLLILIIVFEEIRGRVQGIPRLQPSELTKMINRDEVVVVDLRPHEMFAKGHIISSINIPHTKLDANIDKLKSYHPRQIVLVCSNGQTAPQEGVRLRKEGIEGIAFLSGGIAAWQESGLPLTKD